MDVLLPQHPDAVLHMADLGVGEAFVGSLLHLVGIGVVIEHLLQLPQVLFRRHHIEKRAAGPERPLEFLQRQRGEAVEQQIDRPVCHRQVIGGGYGELHILFPLGGPAEDGLGDVRPRHAGGLPGVPQRPVDGAGVVSLAAAGVQHRRMLRGIVQCQTAQGIPQGGVVVLAEKDTAGGGHALVVAGHFGMLAVGGQQMGVALTGHVIAVARRTAVAPRLPLQRRPADGADEQAHCPRSFRTVTSWIHCPVRIRRAHSGTFSRLSDWMAAAIHQ